MVGMAKRVVAALALLLAVLQECRAFMNMHQSCRAFKCSKKGMTPVTKPDLAFTVNGCGSEITKVTDKPEVLSDCCNWLEACYNICGMKKATCDKRFDKCMRSKCAAIENDDAAKDACDSSAQMLSITAQAMGCAAFQQTQRDVCECVKQDEAAAGNRVRLEHFLKDVDADAKDRSDATVDKLLSKYAGKEAIMYLRLLKKYPSALQADPSKACIMDKVLDVLKTEDTADASSYTPDADSSPVDGEFSSPKKKDTFSVGIDEPVEDLDAEESFGSTKKKDTFVVGLKESDDASGDDDVDLDAKGQAQAEHEEL